MKLKLFSLILIFPFIVLGKEIKIVGLMPTRNEQTFIEQSIHALSKFTDAIVVLDDGSDDATPQILQKIASKYNIEKIITKDSWSPFERDEPGDRNKLLQAGREIGGTHFIVIDADEMLTSNLLKNNILRNLIVTLQPGDSLALMWIQLWRSVKKYRFDNSVWTNNYQTIIFCDDGKCSYKSDFIHTSRIPLNLFGNRFAIQDYVAGLLHFQFVNWRNLLIKQAWYRCLEHIRLPQKSVIEINNRYAPSKYEEELGLKEAPDEWLHLYDFFDASIFNQPEQWREKQILQWFDEYGIDYFKDLDIWDINWQRK